MDQKNKVTQVAVTFLVKYYTVLSQSPETLKNFYHEKSVFTRRSDNQTTASVVGVDNIHNEVMGLGLLGTQVSIKTVDCQQSLNGGLFISCTGIMRKDMEDVSYFHSFFLEKSQTTESYYVLNDILVNVGREPVENVPDEATAAEDQNHISEDIDQTNTTVVAEQQSGEGHFNQVVPITENDYVQTNGIIVNESSDNTTTTAVASSTVVIEESTTTTTTAAVVVAEPSKEEKEESAPSVAGNASTPNGVTKPASANVPAAAASAATTTIATPAPTNTPKTYADILLSSAGASASTQVVAQPVQQQPTPQPQQPAQPTQPTQQQQSNSAKESHKEGCTLFVSFVSNGKFQLETSQLKQVFTQYGAISHVRVLTNYAFVEFEKPEYVQNVISYLKSGHHLTIGENQLKVEEKRVGANNKFNNNNKHNNNNTNNNNNNNNTNNKRDKLQSPQDKHDKLNNNNTNNNNKPKFQQRTTGQGGAAPKQVGGDIKPTPKKSAK